MGQDAYYVNRRGLLVRVVDPAFPGALFNWGSARTVAASGVLKGCHGLFQLVDAGQCGLQCRIHTASIRRVISNQFGQRIQCRRIRVGQRDLLLADVGAG